MRLCLISWPARCSTCHVLETKPTCRHRTSRRSFAQIIEKRVHTLGLCLEAWAIKALRGVRRPHKIQPAHKDATRENLGSPWSCRIRTRTMRSLPGYPRRRALCRLMRFGHWLLHLLQVSTPFYPVEFLLSFRPVMRATLVFIPYVHDCSRNERDDS
ncbi:hypothetical protein EDD16DRAFT_126527 [Pisolithus croceorrhizus]|nr:hypothetical protein EDD16DRAFT_126527 [Pisolithus croceorrhizus]